MNVKVTVGYNCSLILKNVDETDLGPLLDARVLRSAYIDNVEHEYVSDEKITIEIIRNSDIPKLNDKDIQVMRLRHQEELEAGMPKQLLTQLELDI